MTPQKEEIRRRVPLEELLPVYGVQLVPAGRKFKALCPFHQEKTPSFWLDPEKQLYYCYGCQAGGDLFRFVEAIEGVEWRQALEILARRAGVVLDESPGRGRRHESVVELFDAGELAVKFYHDLLLADPRAEIARRYLQSRRISEEMWKRFALGYSLPDWDGLVRHARAKGVAAETLLRAGLARERPGTREHYDLFRGRLMFPITDSQSRVVGFGARTLGSDEPKYLNTPQTAIFDKSQVLYGLAQARAGIRQRREVVVVEGYTDAIAAHQAGLDTFVANLGTAFSQDNARQLSRLAPRAVMVFDGDAAGQKALDRSLDLLVAEDIDIRIYTVRDGKDPCDAILSLGGAEFRRKLDSESVGIFEFKWRFAVDSLGEGSSAADRSRGIDDCLRLVAKLPSVVSRQLVLREIAERTSVEERYLAERLAELTGRSRSRGGAAAAARGRTLPGRAGFDGAGRSGGAQQGAAMERAGQGRMPAGQEGQAGLAGQAGAAPAGRIGDLVELVFECLCALPGRAPALWRELPHDALSALFRDDAAARLRESIERALREPEFSPAALVRDVGDAALQSALVRILQRVEDQQSDVAATYEVIWANCLRDIQRRLLRERRIDLDRQIGAARSENDGDKLRQLIQRRIELNKRMKTAALDAN